MIVKGPATTTRVDFVSDKQIKQAACLLRALQDESLGAGVTPSPIGFDGNRLFIEEQQHPAAR